MNPKTMIKSLQSALEGLKRGIVNAGVDGSHNRQATRQKPGMKPGVDVDNRRPRGRLGHWNRPGDVFRAMRQPGNLCSKATTAQAFDEAFGKDIGAAVAAYRREPYAWIFH